MKILAPLFVSAALLTGTGLGASAQTTLGRDRPATTGTVIEQQPNTTGNDGDLVISRGPNGADTVTTDSAAGGNANLPERAIPNGSAGGGGR